MKISDTLPRSDFAQQGLTLLGNPMEQKYTIGSATTIKNVSRYTKNRSCNIFAMF